jgi:hypothetical protein
MTIDPQIAAIVVGVILLGLAAVGWGVDSRPTLADDYRR